MQIQDHYQFPEIDHRPAPPADRESIGENETAGFPGRAPGTRHSRPTGDFYFGGFGECHSGIDTAVARLLWNCDELRRYLTNNTGSLIDYGERYRSKMPISTSRAEGCVDEIANARMAKKQRMRWSPQGAHRVAVVRAAVLDGRLKPEANSLLAA
jgi:hypothetical protein